MPQRIAWRDVQPIGVDTASHGAAQHGIEGSSEIPLRVGVRTRSTRSMVRRSVDQMARRMAWSGSSPQAGAGTVGSGGQSLLPSMHLACQRASDDQARSGGLLGRLVAGGGARLDWLGSLGLLTPRGVEGAYPLPRCAPALRPPLSQIYTHPKFGRTGLSRSQFFIDRTQKGPLWSVFDLRSSVSLVRSVEGRFATP